MLFLASLALFFAAPSAVTDLGGAPVHLFESGKPTVLVFVRTDCPISNRYAPELQRLYKEYSSRVDFFLVYADPSESPGSIRKHIADYGYPFPPLRDPHHALVKLSKAAVTPEAALFSARGELLYHGRIDDRYVDFGKYKPAADKHDLQDAIDEMLAGKPISEPATRAIGCFLADVQ
jgi:thiol-disulfide isomerase/thioredoxin